MSKIYQEKLNPFKKKFSGFQHCFILSENNKNLKISKNYFPFLYAVLINNFF